MRAEPQERGNDVADVDVDRTRIRLSAGQVGALITGVAAAVFGFTMAVFSLKADIAAKPSTSDVEAAAKTAATAAVEAVRQRLDGLGDTPGLAGRLSAAEADIRRLRDEQARSNTTLADTLKAIGDALDGRRRR